MITASDLARFRDGKRVTLAGIVLVRQKPGSAKGVMFITIEDETGHANLVIWASLFEARRSLILSSSMLGVRGRLQREGEVMHVVAQELTDLSGMLRSVGNLGEFPITTGRGDEAKHGGAPDSRDGFRKARDIYIPSFRVATRDFR